MSRRKKAYEREMLGAALLVGVIWLIATAIANAVHAVGVVIFVAAIVGVLALVLSIRLAAKKKRLEHLTTKYGDAAIVENIIHGRYWHGQTAEQLTDSLGNPHGIDHKLLKTINRQVWKYNPRGVNRYGLRITLDDGVVRSWDHKR